MILGLALIKVVERTNTVVVRNSLHGSGGEIGRIRRDLVAMDVNRERNCYSCKGFGYLAQNCRR